uniref:Plexin-B1 n=1 Tax=Cyprinus carpio TaxID=7962 RepID=A0A8C1XF39_CYPCA
MAFLTCHHPTFLRNDTFFEHLALHPDPKLGRVYLGARDRLYQLSFDLQLEAEEETGPVIDSRDCLPPISDTNCPQAKWTNNHNKLLLVDPYSQELISCGSVYQGICQKRSLDSVGKVLFSAERPVDTQYVAANDPNVSTVGLVALTRGRGKQQPVLFVGRGYTNSQPPISTRNLVMEPVFSYEETSKLAVAGRLSEYDHHFVTSFTHRSYVYFMFYRRDLQSPSREYRTYVSRMCLDDTAYYSYVEVPLSCRSAGGKNYNLLQALHVGLPKSDKVLGKESTVASEEVLLGVFSSHFASSSRPNEESAVCVFSLEQVDKRISATRDLCYTEMGRADGQEVAYIEYEVKSNCANLPANTLDAYPCGSDHTPSPMASRVLVEAEPIFDSPSVRLTAVAVSVREEHTIAFLGDSQGNLHKVFLGPKGEVEEYAVISIHPSAPISRELRLDHQENHLYILTSNMLEKRPVAECEKHLDCQSCLLAHDPYCGWCVLEGKCGLRSECVRGDQKDQWLWSFDIEQQCLSVTFLNPSNISREERRIISLSIPGLPSLEQGEHYSCVFQDRSSLAVVTESGVTCSSPHVHTLPYVSPGQGENIVMCLDALSFFCSCHGCVQSRWGCNWCVNQHMCTHKAVCDKGLMIYNEHVSHYIISSAFSLCFCFDASTPHNLAEMLNLMNETQTTVLPSNPEPNVSDSETSDFLPMSERVSPAVPSENNIITDRQEAQLAPEETEEVDQVENDNATFSAATVLSGDGESDSDPPVYLHLGSTGIDADYQYDSADLQADEGTFVNWGASACPCVEKIQGSSLLPVLTQRKISLLARNLHLYQDKELAYECVMVIEGQTVVVDADVTLNEANPLLLFCLYVLTDILRVLYILVTLYNCSVGHLDCSRCHTADQKYNCVWCGASCVYRESCSQHIEMTCPAPLIHLVEPLSGLVEGGITLTVSGSNLGQKAQDILQSVTVAGVPCTVIPHLYEISSRILCTTTASGEEKSGHISVKVSGGGFGLSSQRFNFQDPKLIEVSPQRGPKAGGTTLTITGRKLLTGRVTDISVLLGNVPCSLIASVQEETIKCLTGASNRTGEHRVTVRYGNTERHLHGDGYYYTPDPNITHAIPSKSFVGGGRVISVFGQNLDVVQKPQMRVTVVLPDSIFPLRRRRRRRKRSVTDVTLSTYTVFLFLLFLFSLLLKEDCEVKTSSLLLCRTPGVDAKVVGGHMLVEFLLDNLRFDFNSVSQSPFIYEPNPILHPLNHRDPTKPYRYKPGSVISVEGENLDLAIFKEEVVALIGEGVCTVKTLTHNHLYCEPPSQQPPLSLRHGRKREGTEAFPEFIVHMGNLNFSLGQVQYDSPSHSIFPLVAQIGVGTVASLVALIVLIIVFIYRRKSKQALRDYKKVQIQLENLETSVRDRCKKEFTDLMTEMMDMTSDLVGSGIPFLEYRRYAERIFFPGHRESPLRRDLDVQECRRATVEQGLNQLSNLLNSKLFLTKFIHTLESQRTFSPRDRGYVASLLTVALHSKLEYFTDILKTLLNDLVEQYIAKNPKLMLRRTETVVEKLLTNWISICLYAFLRHSAGEPLYMLFRAIKHQVDKGPVDAVTGKAKYTLNDNRLLREDLEYHTLTLNVLMQGIGVNETQPVAAKVLDCDTITQVKEKILDQVYKGTSYSNRPHADSVDLEWRSGVAGHLILSDEDLTSVVQGNWKRLNTLQHYKVPDGATVALVLRHSKHIHHDTHDYIAGEKTPMLEDADEEGVRLWHLVKASEEPELPKHRRGSLKERERAKTIPEIYLTRLLSMKGTLQKFVDDLFTVILSTSQPVPLAIKYFFDLLDDQAVRHGISDSETIHIWKTNSLPLRFWINIVKNPQFIFDVQVSDNVDAVLSVIAQTFMDSCTTTEHKLGRDSPINKLLYARDIPRYKQMVERYYADIKQTISASDQDMNSALAELSRNYSGELNYLVALHELYKYINKYYDQIITALEEDTTAQKMQLGYRLQQIAAAVENKVTDL